MSIEAMKQAIRDLEDASEMAYSEFSIENLYGETIDALRQAIANEALDKKAENVRELGLDYEAVQAEKQAPYIAVYNDRIKIDPVTGDVSIGTPAAQQGMTIDASAPLVMTPHPAFAKRQWVGLTEKDFSAINQSCLTKLQAATSAESILKEKNT